jgi:cytochrome c553
MSARLAALVCAAWLAGAPPKLGEPAPDAPVLEGAARSLAELRGRRVVALDWECRPAGLDTAREQLAGRGVELVRARLAGHGGFWLVDDNGLLRAAEPAPETAAQILAFLDEWELGKRSFEWGCTNCHGKDGRDTTQYGVKSLAGVGNRMSREQLRRTLNATMIAPGRYSIRCFHYSERELKALVTYVSGL